MLTKEQYETLQNFTGPNGRKYVMGEDATRLVGMFRQDPALWHWQADESPVQDGDNSDRRVLTTAGRLQVRLYEQEKLGIDKPIPGVLDPVLATDETSVTLTLSAEEAKGLLKLLRAGTSYGALTSLHLGDLMKGLGDLMKDEIRTIDTETIFEHIAVLRRS